MTRVIADQSLKPRLMDCSERLEICDESGRVLGVFVPTPDEERAVYDWAKAEFSREEMEEAGKIRRVTRRRKSSNI